MTAEEIRTFALECALKNSPGLEAERLIAEAKKIEAYILEKSQ